MSTISFILLYGGMLFFTVYAIWPDIRPTPIKVETKPNQIKMDTTQKLMMANNEVVNPTTIWVLFFFLGWSYGSMGQMGLQILYYLTFGGLGIWTIVRLFTLNKAITDYNNKIYMKYGLNEMIK